VSHAGSFVHMQLSRERRVKRGRRQCSLSLRRTVPVPIRKKNLVAATAGDPEGVATRILKSPTLKPCQAKYCLQIGARKARSSVLHSLFGQPIIWNVSELIRGGNSMERFWRRLIARFAQAERQRAGVEFPLDVPYARRFGRRLCALRADAATGLPLLITDRLSG
jgi:hypothetical protein